MNVSLTPELDDWVHQKVKSGFYNSASEVIRESLRFLRERDQQKQALLQELRSEIRLGAEQLDNGMSQEFTSRTVEQIKELGRKKLSK